RSAPDAAPGGDAPIAGSDARPPRRLRPREKLVARGVAALSDAELLALLLGSGTPGRSALRIARALARRSPVELAGWPLTRWLRVQGIGPARATAVLAAFEIGRRAAEPSGPAPAIRGPE